MRIIVDDQNAPASQIGPASTARRRRFNPDRDVKEWTGAYVPYDIVKEAFVAFLAVAVLMVLLAVLFSSPDESAITLKSWSGLNPVDFAQTSIMELVNDLYAFSESAAEGGRAQTTAVVREAIDALVVMLSPFAPHTAEELWQLLGHTTNRRELARELDPDSPLLHHGLIQASDRGRPFQALAANPIVVKLLAGSTVDDDLEHGVARVPATVPLDELMIPTVTIDRGLADLAAAPPGLARVVVTGRSGSGRRSSATVLSRMGKSIASV